MASAIMTGRSTSKLNFVAIASPVTTATATTRHLPGRSRKERQIVTIASAETVAAKSVVPIVDQARMLWHVSQRHIPIMPADGPNKLDAHFVISHVPRRQRTT